MTLWCKTVSSREEAEAIFALRYKIYVEEMGHYPPEADHNKHMLEDALDPFSVIYALFDEDRVVGTVRTTCFADLPDPAPLRKRFESECAESALDLSQIILVSRYMVAPAYRTGFGAVKVAVFGYEGCMQRGYRLAFSDCSPDKYEGYQMLGYRKYSEAFVDETYGMKYRIMLLLLDHAYLKKFRSPFMRLAKQYPDDAQLRDWFAVTYPEAKPVDTA